jgi:dTDP-L-rhamnose 4-epimerase
MTLTVTHAYGMEGAALRLWNAYGPGQALSNPYTGVLAIFAARIANGQPPMIFEDGEQRRDFVHAEDVARPSCWRWTGRRRWADLQHRLGRGPDGADVAADLARAMGRDDVSRWSPAACARETSGTATPI